MHTRRAGSWNGAPIQQVSAQWQSSCLLGLPVLARLAIGPQPTPVYWASSSWGTYTVDYVLFQTELSP